MKKHGRRYLVTGEIRVSDEDFEDVNSIELKNIIRKAIKEYVSSDNGPKYDVKFQIDVTYLERY